MARGEGGEKILERAVTFIVPVKLLVSALQESLLRKKGPFVLVRKGDVNG